MRSEFQDVFKEAYDHWIDDVCSHRYRTSKSLALQVWQHQQSKVEELQKQRDSFIKAYDIEMGKNIELQKRVDKAIRLLVEAELYQSEPNIDLAVQALKGDGK